MKIANSAPLINISLPTPLPTRTTSPSPISTTITLSLLVFTLVCWTVFVETVGRKAAAAGYVFDDLAGTGGEGLDSYCAHFGGGVEGLS
jgi:hypothetical protein